jgi:hypothetical protein
MKGFLTLLTGIFTLLELPGGACADDADLYAVQFSEDSQRIAVACSGGLIKVFDAVSCKPLWEQRNIGYRQEELDERLIQTRATGSGLERPLFSLARSQ